MTQTIYTSVNNADIVPCGKKGKPISSDPIPLLRDKYLGEYRTELEKAKARKNLGISDEYSLEWGNIQGFVEKQKDLVEYVEQKWSYTNDISEDITNVKEALDYAIYFISNFKSDSAEIARLGLEVLDIRELISETEASLQNSISENADNIIAILETIGIINESIEALNEALKNIDVDANILQWVKASLENSKTIELVDEKTIELIVSLQEGNAVQVLESLEGSEELPEILPGVYVRDLAPELLETNKTVEEIQSELETMKQDVSTNTENITNILTELETVSTYLTELPDDTQSPEDVGGISQGTTVLQLKGKTLSLIVDTLLFPTVVRDLVYPVLYYDFSSRVLEVGTYVLEPTLTFILNDAGIETGRLEEFTYNGSEYTLASYDSIGTYTYTGKVLYDAGEYLVDNKGQITDKRVEAGELTTTAQVIATYPWYSGNTNGIIKLALVPFNSPSGTISFSLSGQAIIKLPGANTLLESFTVDGGLGYLNVDLNGWTYSTELIGGYIYKVWTKKDSYSAALPHRINFTLAL